MTKYFFSFDNEKNILEFDCTVYTPSSILKTITKPKTVKHCLDIVLIKRDEEKMIKIFSSMLVTKKIFLLWKTYFVQDNAVLNVLTIMET